MHSFHINSFSAAVILATLFMGILGAFVLIPIGCIQWIWNFVAPQIFALPTINPWQAMLLYIAGVCLLYLFGLVQIEITSEAIEDGQGATLTERLHRLQARIREKNKSRGRSFDKDEEPTDRED